MNSIVKNILAVVFGLIVGSLVNIGLVQIGPMVIPLPAGADVSTMEGLQASMRLFTPENFLFPFLAHALGTLVGAFVAARFAANHKMKFALLIGLLFLLGGISMVYSIGGPTWFNVTDLSVAYIPMALLGGLLAGGKKTQAS